MADVSGGGKRKVNTLEIKEIAVTVHRWKRPEKGQARRRADLQRWFACLRAQTVVWYVFLAFAGVMLYEVGAAYALRERGYFAVGGEALALLLPVFYYVAEAIIRDIMHDLENNR